MLSIIVIFGVILLVYGLLCTGLYIYMDDTGSRATIVGWFIGLGLVILTCGIAGTLGVGAALSVGKGAEILYALGCIIAGMVAFVLAIMFPFVASDIKDTGYDIVNALERSKKNKVNKRLLSDAEIEQEARIRIKMEKYRNTITATKKELEIQKYVNEKRG